jgi:hypothetical protein
MFPILDSLLSIEQRHKYDAIKSLAIPVTKNKPKELTRTKAIWDVLVEILTVEGTALFVIVLRVSSPR